MKIAVKAFACVAVLASLTAGYGFADRSRWIPVTPETLFPLAPVTKLFTATAVMQLVEQGRIE